MDHPALTWLLALFAVAVLTDIVLKRLERNLRLRVVSTREPWTDEQIYESYYTDSGMPFDRFRVAWQTVGRTLNVDPGRLRPGDPLDLLKGLPPWLRSRYSPDWSDVAELEPLLAAQAQCRRTPLPARFLTIDEAVRFLGS